MQNLKLNASHRAVAFVVVPSIAVVVRLHVVANVSFGSDLHGASLPAKANLFFIICWIIARMYPFAVVVRLHVLASDSFGSDLHGATFLASPPVFL